MEKVIDEVVLSAENPEILSREDFQEKHLKAIDELDLENIIESMGIDAHGLYVDAIMSQPTEKINKAMADLEWFTRVADDSEDIPQKHDANWEPTSEDPEILSVKHFKGKFINGLDPLDEFVEDGLGLEIQEIFRDAIKAQPIKKLNEALKKLKWCCLIADERSEENPH
jgi:hypothetical protein